jgi:hypothetical protein
MGRGSTPARSEVHQDSEVAGTRPAFDGVEAAAYPFPIGRRLDARMTQITTLKSGQFWVDAEGLLRGKASAAAEQDLAEARAQIAAQRALGVSLPRPFLMDIREARSLSRDARAFYASAETGTVFSATALLVSSPVSRAIGNFFIGLNKPSMPTRLFGSEAEAVEWLRTFLP